MKELVEKISSAMDEFLVDANRRVEGNKAAGQRARKVSLEIDKLLKEFRKVSVK